MLWEHLLGESAQLATRIFYSMLWMEIPKIKKPEQANQNLQDNYKSRSDWGWS